MSSDTEKTVPQFHMDYIIRNISFWFEFVHLKVDTSNFFDSIDFSLICIWGFSVNQENLKENEPVRGGLKPMHSILSLDGKFRFQIIYCM